ncbi:hypothetical protein CAMRE0001_1471 [Campylobacter rectus RM3267]|uniref:Uncharacterized protein n=1 Tax=Campylobacter rectus RM3267 TaxID=553218 RepID=B9D337_CAMRE|nr:hypothetical protein CAMRE0001_1471 [Campylobacter rectus RM3267]
MCKPRSLYERGLGVKNAQKAGENPAQGLRGERRAYPALTSAITRC